MSKTTIPVKECIEIHSSGANALAQARPAIQGGFAVFKAAVLL
jgi:hypothetical protein